MKRPHMTAGNRRAQLVRSVVCSVVERSTSNSDAKGAVHDALSRLADALDDGLWPVTDADIDRIMLRSPR